MNSPAERGPHVPGFRYAAEHKGARNMRFSPELEHEYLRLYLAERRGHLRSFNSILCALFMLASAVGADESDEVPPQPANARVAVSAI